MIAIGILFALLASGLFSGPPVQPVPIYVSASFMDKNRLYLDNLSREEVRVLEDGEVREVAFLASDEIPIVYGMLFDRALFSRADRSYELLRWNQSNVPPVVAAVSTAYQLVDLCMSTQVGWVGVYDQELEVALGFSQDAHRVKEAIQQLRGRKTTEESDFYSAVFGAVDALRQRHEKRRVLIVFLEVLDRNAGERIKPLKNLLSASNVELFVASFASRFGPGYGLPPLASQTALKELSDCTAGSAFFKDTATVEAMGRRISDQIRSFYTIGFESYSASGQPGTLTIECTRPGVKVRSHSIVPNLQ